MNPAAAMEKMTLDLQQAEAVRQQNRNPAPTRLPLWYRHFAGLVIRLRNSAGSIHLAYQDAAHLDGYIAALYLTDTVSSEEDRLLRSVVQDAFERALPRLMRSEQ